MKTNTCLICLALLLAFPLMLCSQHSLGLQSAFLQRQYILDGAVYSKIDQSRLSYNTGMDYWYQFPDSRWAAYGALGFANYRRKYIIGDSKYHFDDGFAPADNQELFPGPLPPGPSLEDLGPSYYSDRYITLRGGARFTFKKGALSLFCLPFAGINAYLNSRRTVWSENGAEWARSEKTERLDFTGAIRLASGLGAGLSYQLAPGTHLYFMPRAELFFQGKIKTDTLLFWGVALGAWHDLNSGS